MHLPKSGGRSPSPRTCMHEIATLNFRDPESSDDACAIVRAGEGQVALCLTLKSDGDVEVFLSVDMTKSLIEALNRAVIEASAA